MVGKELFLSFSLHDRFGNNVMKLTGTEEALKKSTYLAEAKQMLKEEFFEMLVSVSHSENAKVF
jgi:hypothetical protein